MSQLIKELKQEHVEILEILNRIKSIGINQPGVQELLLSAKQSLLKHLEKEDEELYPRLREEAKYNFELKKELDTFAKDAELITLLTMAFFDKYESGLRGYKLLKDFELMSSNILTRIKNEESQLYSKYDEIF